MTETTPADAAVASAPPPVTTDGGVLGAAAAAEAATTTPAAPATTEPAKTEPAKVEPAKTEPAKAEEPPAAATGLEIPDGFKPDEKMVADFKAEAAEIGLDSAKAQKLFDRYIGLEVARAKADEDAFVAQDNRWQAELKADPEVGGEKQAQAVMHVRRAIKEFGGVEVAKVLAQAGLGNHPALVRGFAKIGRALAEDSVSGAAQPADEKRGASFTDLMYPTMTPSKTKE